MLNIIKENLLWFISWTTGGKVSKFSDLCGTAAGIRIIILFLLILGSAVFLVYRLSSSFSQKDKPSEIITLCFDCGNYEKRALTGPIEEARCSKCGGKIGEAWHCPDCDKDFPFILPKDAIEGKASRRKAWEAVDKAYRCPHCNSQNTHCLTHGCRRE